MREDWIEVEIGEVGEIITGNTPSKTNSLFYTDKRFPFYKPTDLDAGENVCFSNDGLSEEGFNNSRTAPEGSILVTCIGATIGKTGLIKKSGAFNQQINGIIPSKIILSKFLYFQVIGLEFQRKIKENASSTTLPILNKSKFSILEITLAPLPIQRAIVSKIEALFSDLDNGIANFKKAQEQFKIYRQAVLKKAFEGGFSITNEELKITNRELRITNEENLDSDNLPKGWKWVKLGEICEKIFDGPFGSNLKTDDYVNEGIRVIRLENVKSMNFDDSKKSYVSIDKYETIKRHTVFPTDIIMSTFISEKVNVCQIPENIKFAINKADCIGIRLKDVVKQKYVLYALSLRSTYTQLEVLVHGATRPRVNTTQIKNIQIPFCISIAEQTQIVQEIERRLSVCDKMEQSIKESLAKAEALRQSILKKAFEGKLLTEAEIQQCKQEADYEPASELLKKITNEKLRMTNEKKVKKVKIHNS